MAKVQYITVPESTYISGIDARSAETSIDPGFVKDLLNADIIGKRVRKRVGVQGYSGNIPVRVTALEYISTGVISLTLDSAVSLSDTTVDLTSTRSSPLVLHGRTSNVSTGAPFLDTGDTSKYYPAFVVPTRKTFVQTPSAPPYEILTVTAGEHAISTTDMFVGVVESTSLTNKSYGVALPNSVSIDKSTFDIAVAYQNSTGVDAPVYVYYKDHTVSAGESYLATFSHTGSGVETFTVSPSTHGLDNFNILVSTQQDTGSNVEVVDSVTTLHNDGSVSVSIDATTSGTFYALMTATTVTNSTTGNVEAGSTSSVLISDLTSPWAFYGIYLEITPGGDKELVTPDSIVYDDVGKTTLITFTNNMPTGANFYVYYEYGVIRSNRIQLLDSDVTVDAVDDRPQLTIWGLDHAEIYGTTPPGRSGWTTHIDSYKSAGNRRVVVGLGGNLFSSQTFDEEGGTYLYPLLYPRLQARTASSRVLGPVFYDTGETPARSNGYILSDDSGTGWAKVTSIAYNVGTGFTDVTLSLPGKQILDSTGTPTTLDMVVTSIPQLEDYLTLQNMSYTRHEGTFRITDATDGVDSIVVSVDMPTNASDYDDTGLGGDGGIFTDQIPWLTSSPFIPGDVLHNAALGDTHIYTVRSSLGSTTVVSGVQDRLNLAGGLITTGQRTSSLVSLREALPLSTPSVENVVRGDMLAYTEIERLLRVIAVNSDSDRTVDISVDPINLIATVTLISGDTSHILEGGKVLLLQASSFSGAQTVVELVSATTFTIAMTSASQEAVTGSTLVGGVIEVDEELTWEDSSGDQISFFADRRWIPIEAPDDLYDLTPSTYVRQLDSAAYGEQDFLRSTMVVDNMYLTNYSDEVFKYDGTSLYRAGLPSWQPGLFITQDTAPDAKIVIDNRSVTYTAGTAGAPAGRIKLSGALDSGVLPIGTTVRLTGSTMTYTVSAYTDNGTDYYLLFDRSLDATVADTGTASEIATYRYYFRLNAVDANDNIIASATTGYQDHVVELTANAAVHLRLVGFPAWDDYDYDRLEVQIYRTHQSLPAPFYTVTTLQIPFDKWTGYIDYTDTFADSDLIDLDIVNTALKGEELGIQWQEPLRAKYVTSIQNRLVLANVKDYPQLDVQILAPGSVTNAAYAGKTLTFRRSNLDAGTVTDMVDTAVYEFVNGTTGTVSALTPGTNSFSFTTSSSTGASPGDWIYLSYSTVATTARDLQYCGLFQIASVSGMTVTVNMASVPAVISAPDVYTIATVTRNIPVLLGVDGNLGMVNGNLSSTFDLFGLTRRLSLALNSSMRSVDPTVSGMETFVPWLMSRSGNDSGKSGRIIVRRPRAGSEIPELVLPSSFTGSGQSFQMFVNDIRRSPSDQVSAVTKVFPSRLLVSYPNYPEIMDNPTSILDTESDSAIDVNSADGQEITGVIPFFGEAAYGAAQQSAVLVVFKSNSIYLVDLNQKAAGQNAVQRIETENLGCTAPYSITSTKGGIMFANESGIYCLRQDQTIQYIGKFMERNWLERVNFPLLGIVQGHHYSQGRMYKLSVPVDGSETNNEVYVYNHTEEISATPYGSGQAGGWSRYDNHPATGWANLDTDAFYSSTQGRVLSLRDTDTVSDYRDSSDPIHMILDTRAMDGGDAGIRKILDAVIVYYRVIQTDEGTSVDFAVDTEQEYTPTTRFVIKKASQVTGTADIVTRDVIAILHSVGRRRGTSFQIRIQNATLDENLEVAGIELRLGGLSDKGILMAATTTAK